MLLNLGDEKRITDRVTWKQTVAIGLSLAFVMQVLYIVGFGETADMKTMFAQAVDIGTVEYIGKDLLLSLRSSALQQRKLSSSTG